MSGVVGMDEPGLDVSACLARVRAGEEAASCALMAYLHPLVVKIVRGHLPRRTDEEDLVQAIYIKVFTKLDQYRGEVPLEHWVSRVAVNTCLNEIAREKHRPEWRHADLGEEEVEVLQNLAADTRDLGAEQAVGARELVEKMLADLSPEDRLVITMLHMEGRTVEEIQTRTGWSRPLVKVRAFRARAKMKKHLVVLMKQNVP